MFELDDDHVAFRQTCREFVTREALPLTEQAERDGRFPAALWPALGKAGMLGLGHPEEHGGSGQGHGALAMAILSEELAKSSGGVAITPLVSAYMAAPHLTRYGNDEQKATWLAPVVAGEMCAAIAVTEPGAGSDVAGMRATAKRNGDGWVLNGTKMFITNAGIADVVLAGAKTDADASHRGITMFIVPKDTPGFSFGAPLEKVGWHASDTREVVFDDVHLPDDAILGAEGRGFYQIMEAFQVERLVLAGMGVGLAQAAYDDALAYAKERQTFGQPLGRYQAISHALGEMRTEIEAARLMVYRAGALIDADKPFADEVAMAKLFAARIANEVADRAVQILGGYGWIEETRIAMHWRDARILRIGGGTDEVQLNILAKNAGL